MPPTQSFPLKGTQTPLLPCNECLPRALGPISARRGALERSMLPQKSLPMASVAAHPGGSPISPARRCPSKGTRMPLPPCNECLPRALGLVSACQGALKPSSEHVALKKRASGQRRGSPMPPARLFPSKGTRMPLPPRQRVPSPGTRPHLGSLRSPQALERACCLGKELDASSPCLYRSYEGFTRCSCVLVRSHLRTSRGSTCDDVS